MNKVTIRKALAEEAGTLTALSFAAKGYWNYPPSYLERWRQELTITPTYVEENEVFVCAPDGDIRAYYSLVTLKEEVRLAEAALEAGTWLDHMFVHPQFIGQNLGRLMFEHLRRLCEKRQVRVVHILADPHSQPFYQKMGCRYKGEYPSSIAGRTTPYFLCDMGEKTTNTDG